MFKKYRKTIFINMKKYDKKAQNPFLKNDFNSVSSSKNIHEKIYIWIEKNYNQIEF